MKLKYNHDSFTEEIPLTTDKPAGKSLAIRHDNETYYAPLVDVSDANASAVHIVSGGEVYSVPMIVCCKLYYADGTVETAPAGTALDLGDYSGVTKALSNKGGTITAGSNGTAIGGKNVSLIGGAGNDVFVHVAGNNTIANYAAGDVISLSSYDATDIIAVKVDSVNGGATLGFDEGDSLVIEGATNTTPITLKSAADTGGTRYFFANNSIDAGYNVTISGSATAGDIITRNLYAKNIEQCITYNNYRRTAITLNGSAEAVNGKKKFIADSLLAGEYSNAVVSIVASGSMVRDGVYIQGNSKANYIVSNNKGNSLDGGKGNDYLYSGAGADTFVYQAGTGTDIVYRFKDKKDKIVLRGTNGETLTADDFTAGIGSYNSYGDIVFRINGDTSGNLRIVDPFSYNGTTYIATTVNGTAYTYYKSGLTISGNKVTLNSATEYNITTANKTNGVTITDYSAGVNIMGLNLNDIKTCSYSGSAITLGLESANVVLQGAATNALKLNGATVYVGTDMVFNAADSISATRFSLTADNTAGIDIAGTSTAIRIDASRTQSGITLIGGTGNDTLIGSAANDSLTGNAGADLFVYNGGHDVIVDYSAADGDKISVTADDMLNFSVYPFGGVSDADITINGTEGNSLVIKGGVGQIVTLLSTKGTSKELNYSHIIDNDDGRINTAETSIVLKNRTTNFEPTADVYPKLATIDASYVTTPNIAVRAVNSIASCIIAGNSGMSLYGGSKLDTLISGAGNDVLTGGAGADVFVHTGGKTTITDYTASNLDKIHLANGIMGDVSGVTVGADKGITLTFGGDCTGTICVPNIAKTETVTFASANDTWGTGYVFYDDTVRTASGRGVTLTKAESHTLVGEEVSVIANNGGTIIGGGDKATYTVVTLGGYNVSIVAGTDKEVFLYKGGNMTIDGHGVKDTISLLADCTLPWSLPRSETYTLQTSAGNVILKNHNLDTLNSFVINSNGTNETILFYDGNPSLLGANGDKVTLFGTTGDFGVLGSASGITDGQLVVNGSEYYTAIVSVTATQEDSHIVSNTKANTFVVSRGDSNILTGGIKNDTFIFEAGGGVITDFGVGATKNGENKYLATTTKRTGTDTYVAFDRDNPLSYSEGTDVLKVNGTVVEIAFKQDSEDYDSSTESSFTAYVTYVAGGNYSTIALANIRKKATKTDKAGGGAGAVYTTNAEQMQGDTYQATRIFDTRTGTSAELTGETWTSLFVDKSNSAHSSAIARLDALIQARGITTYSADGKVASTSNGIAAAYAAQQGGTS